MENQMIKDKIIELRNKDNSLRTLLGTVLGELDRITKTPTDEQCVQVIKKMIESLRMINGMKEKEEIFTLEQFLPSQLTETQIEDIIQHLHITSIKECMEHFKNHYNGKYDGKLVSKIYSQLNKK